MTAGRRPQCPGQRRFASLTVAAALAVVAALASSGAAAAAAPPPKLDWQPCADPAQKGFQCANPRVPRSYERPDGATIHLGVIRHRATDPEHRVGTLFVNFGGPGASKTSLPTYYSHYLPAELRARFDILTWDPRGIGDSTAVQCFDSQQDENRFLAGVGLAGETFPVGKAEKTRWIRRYRAYGRRCERTNGGLLRHVSTTDSARDMNLLRRAVGERRLTYWGISWGTILGANYANLFPKRVRALVLDGDVNPRAWVRRGAKLAGDSFLDTFLRQRSDRGAARTLDAFLELLRPRRRRPLRVFGRHPRRDQGEVRHPAAAAANASGERRPHLRRAGVQDRLRPLCHPLVERARELPARRVDDRPPL